MSEPIREVTTDLLALCMAVLMLTLAYSIVYSDRVDLGVSAGDVALGSVTVEETTSLLIDRLADPEIQVAGPQATKGPGV
jgi:hypothetical protein